MPSARTESPPPSPPESLEIRCWPLRDEGLRGWLPVAAALLLAGLAWYSTGSQGAGAFALVLAICASWRAWMPVTFAIGPKGIVERCGRRVRHIPWLAVERLEVRGDGVLLVPVRQPAALDYLRAIHLPHRGQPEQLVRCLELYCLHAKKHETW